MDETDKKALELKAQEIKLECLRLAKSGTTTYQITVYPPHAELEVAKEYHAWVTEKE